MLLSSVNSTLAKVEESENIPPMFEKVTPENVFDLDIIFNHIPDLMKNIVPKFVFSPLIN